MLINMFLSPVIAYLIGSVPFGLLAGRLLGVDIRKMGSGNIGATNVFRNLGPVPGAVVLLLDAAKGAAPVYIAQYMLVSPDLHYKYLLYILTGAFAIVGHMFPLFLGFKGGKGGATGLGVLIALMPGIALIAAVTFVASLVITRYVSVSTMTGSVLASVSALCSSKPVEYIMIMIIMTLFIIYKHVPNIKRIMAGTEPKVGIS